MTRGIALDPNDPGIGLQEPVRTIYARCRERADRLRQSANWCLFGVLLALIIGAGAVIGASTLARLDVEQALGAEAKTLIAAKRSRIESIKNRLKADDLNVETIQRLIEEDLSHAGAVWRRPAKFFNLTLRAVQFLGDGRAGWAVGRGGTILATGDGGQTWKPQASGTENTLWAVQFLGAGRAGWAVGSGGTILATGDGGQTWKLQASGTENTLWAVQFLGDGRAGWAVGSGGTILISQRPDPVPAVPSAEPDLGALTRFLSEAPAASLPMAPAYKKRLQTRIDLERLRDDLVKEIRVVEAGSQQRNGDGGTGFSFITNTTAIRAGIIVLILFLVQILVHLSRYNTRLAGFYSARADVLLLSGNRRWDAGDLTVSDVRQLMDAFSPDVLDFGKSPATAVDRIANLARDVSRVGRNPSS